MRRELHSLKTAGAPKDNIRWASQALRRVFRAKAKVIVNNSGLSDRTESKGAVEGMGLVRDNGGRRGHDHKLYINSVRLDVGKFMYIVIESVSSGMIYQGRLWVREV